jgi:hypothetical protein
LCARGEILVGIFKVNVFQRPALMSALRSTGNTTVGLVEKQCTQMRA